MYSTILEFGIPVSWLVLCCNYLSIAIQLCSAALLCCCMSELSALLKRPAQKFHLCVVFNSFLQKKNCMQCTAAAQLFPTKKSHSTDKHIEWVMINKQHPTNPNPNYNNNHILNSTILEFGIPVSWLVFSGFSLQDLGSKNDVENQTSNQCIWYSDKNIDQYRFLDYFRVFGIDAWRKLFDSDWSFNLKVGKIRNYSNPKQNSPYL